MKHVKSFALFENEKALTPRQIKFLDKHTKGSWSVNPATGLVDVDGDFNCTRSGIKTLLGIKFGVVSGGFYFGYNKLTSLEGAPQEVGKDFYCFNNKLTSLEGAPREVGGDFDCSSNQLTSLEGSPQEVGGKFDCESNQLTSLKGAPQEVGGDFDCSRNQLVSLEGAPEKVGDGFYLGSERGFKWTTEGKLEYMREDPEWAPLIAPTLPYDSLLDVISGSPTLLKAVEDFDKEMYNKILKDLGWDKMGPDLLRQLKNGML